MTVSLLTVIRRPQVSSALATSAGCFAELERVGTRPIGASFADYFGMPKASGGLGIGHGPVSPVTIALMVTSIWYLARTGKDRPSVPAGERTRNGLAFAGDGYRREAGSAAEGE